MCLTIPLKVLSVKAGQAVVSDGRQKFLVARGRSKAKKGDYVLIQQKIIIKKIPKIEAKQILNLWSQTTRR
jgi:hydrogenase maturation factor